MADNKITKDTTLGELLAKYPETASSMLKRGLHCVGCHVAAWETVEQGAKSHGMDDKQIAEMIEEMNKLINEKKGS